MKYNECELKINGQKQGDFFHLAECWEEIEKRYQALPDQYSDSLTWEIVQWVEIDGDERLRSAGQSMEAGLWYAYAEDAETFRQWLNLFGWEWAVTLPPPRTPNPPHDAVS